MRTDRSRADRHVVGEVMPHLAVPVHQIVSAGGQKLGEEVLLGDDQAVRWEGADL